MEIGPVSFTIVLHHTAHFPPKYVGNDVGLGDNADDGVMGASQSRASAVGVIICENLFDLAYKYNA